MSKRAKEKGASEKSAVIRDYYWKPRYFRQTDEDTIQCVCHESLRKSSHYLLFCKEMCFLLKFSSLMMLRAGLCAPALQYTICSLMVQFGLQSNFRYCVDKDPTSEVKGEFKLSHIQYLKVLVFTDGSEKFNIGWMGPNGNLERMHLRVPGRAMLDPWVCNLIVRCRWLSNNKPLEDDAKLFLAGSITVVDWARHARVAKKGLLLKAYNGPMTSSDIANHDRKLQDEDAARIRNCRSCNGSSQIRCHFCNGTAWNNGRDCVHCMDRNFHATGTQRCPACLPTEYT
jgi:hypothetical protein